MADAPAAPTCGGTLACPHWRAPKPMPEGPSARYVSTHGDCTRFPQTVSKKADEVCGEHPELTRRRTLPTLIDAEAAPQQPRRFGRNR